MVFETRSGVSDEEQRWAGLDWKTLESKHYREGLLAENGDNGDLLEKTENGFQEELQLFARPSGMRLTGSRDSHDTG